MKDFITRDQSGPEISKAVAGKTIVKVELPDDMDDLLVFHFTDGSALRIRYDWLYEWELAVPTEEAITE